MIKSSGIAFQAEVTATAKAAQWKHTKEHEEDQYG